MTPAPSQKDRFRDSLALFACPNPDCECFNRFDAGNLAVAERMGKHKAIRRLYCKSCGRRFSEREGSLMAYTKLPVDTVVRLIKCLAHGCSIEATADICEVDPRTVARMLEKAGKRAEDFHHLMLDKMKQPVEAVELDEVHGRVNSAKPGEKGGETPGLVRRVARRVGSGFTWLWRR
jgi:transposase-like protein